jgi:hypothetical protein
MTGAETHEVGIMLTVTRVWTIRQAGRDILGQVFCPFTKKTCFYSYLDTLFLHL